MPTTNLDGPQILMVLVLVRYRLQTACGTVAVKSALAPRHRVYRQVAFIWQNNLYHNDEESTRYCRSSQLTFPFIVKTNCV